MATKKVAKRLHIAGSEGTDASPITSPPEPVAPAPKRRGLLVRNAEGQLVVKYAGTEIPVDVAAGTIKTPVHTPKGIARAGMPEELLPALAAANKHRAALMAKPGVFSVRAGYEFRDGQISKQPCVVVAVRELKPLDSIPAKDRLPVSVDGIPVDVAQADLVELMKSQTGEESAALLSKSTTFIEAIQSDEVAEMEEAAKRITYEPPQGATLPEVNAAMVVTCHVSPDAGWKVLKPFLQTTAASIQLGMYDFTAPHIVSTVRRLLRGSEVEWQMVLDSGEALADDPDSPKANDLPEADVIKSLKRAAGRRFQSAFAHTGSGQTFASAYHIKVLVRDDAAFWLSSGNWQSSNQPDIDFLASDADRRELRNYNREWHVTVENKQLAGIFQTYLNHDFEVASAPAEEAGAVPLVGPDFLMALPDAEEEEAAAATLQVFAPRKFVFTSSKKLRVQPILTPDNYMDHLLTLLRKRPRKKLYFQNQSLNPVKQPTPEFAEAMQLLAEYSQDESLDVRLIFRNIGSVRKKLESLQAAGFEMSRVRLQTGCHTKGLIVDSEVVLVGSHNFTNEGTQLNRDASLLFFNADIARYYEDVFLHDWERMSKASIREELAPRLASADETASLGDDWVRLPWSAYLEE